MHWSRRRWSNGHRAVEWQSSGSRIEGRIAVVAAALGSDSCVVGDGVVAASVTVTAGGRHKAMSHGAQLESVVDPDAPSGVDEAVDHVDGVVRGRRDAQQLVTTRHRRVVDRLQVDAVLGHQLIGQLHHQLRIADLRKHGGAIRLGSTAVRMK